MIEHKEPRLKIKYSLKYQGQEGTTVFNLTTDGKENINQTVEGGERSTTHWEAGKLVTQWKVIDQGKEGKILRFLSSDGLTQYVEYHNPKSVIKIVFAKKRPVR